MRFKYGDAVGDMSGTTDVVIIGAGLAGLTLATLLRRDGVDRVVLEARRLRRRPAVLGIGWFTVLADAPPPRHPRG